MQRQPDEVGSLKGQAGQRTALQCYDISMQNANFPYRCRCLAIIKAVVNVVRYFFPMLFQKHLLLKGCTYRTCIVHTYEPLRYYPSTQHLRTFSDPCVEAMTTFNHSFPHCVEMVRVEVE